MVPDISFQRVMTPGQPRIGSAFKYYLGCEGTPRLATEVKVINALGQSEPGIIIAEDGDPDALHNAPLADAAKEPIKEIRRREQTRKEQ